MRCANPRRLVQQEKKDMTDIVPLVKENSLRVSDAGYEIQLRLKWYRSLPLSCIEKLQLAFDGQPVDPSRMRLSVNGHVFRLDELTDLVEEFWFVQDSLILSVHEPRRASSGESHQIDVELALRFPYIPIGPDRFLTHVHNYSAVQVAS
jgi:hypothetical protein